MQPFSIQKLSYLPKQWIINVLQFMSFIIEFYIELTDVFFFVKVLNIKQLLY